jgi:hypothetical protein
MNIKDILLRNILYIIKGILTPNASFYLIIFKLILKT